MRFIANLKCRMISLWPIVALLLISCLSACQTTKPAAIEAKPEHHPGKFSWFALLTQDSGAAQKFYGELFGWRFEPTEGFVVIYNQSEEIGGIFQIETSDKDPLARWLGSLSVADVRLATTYVSEVGGTVHEGPGLFAGRGEYALISDPQGGQLALLTALDGDPPDSTPQIGSWLWTELWTDNPLAAVKFYRGLANYQIHAIDTGKVPYLILSKDGQWRAGINPLDKPIASALWLPSIRVADSKAIATKASQLGGEVLSAPGSLPGDGEVVVLADPAGALFMVERWSEGGAK